MPKVLLIAFLVTAVLLVAGLVAEARHCIRGEEFIAYALTVAASYVTRCPDIAAQLSM